MANMTQTCSQSDEGTHLHCPHTKGNLLRFVSELNHNLETSLSALSTMLGVQSRDGNNAMGYQQLQDSLNKATIQTIEDPVEITGGPGSLRA